MPTLFLAGASGVLGGRVLDLARERGYRIRALTRSAKHAARLEAAGVDVVRADAERPETLKAACQDCDTVFSALGASVTDLPGARAPFSRVDFNANRNLLAEAKRAGVKRFVYVSVHPQPGYASTAYVAAHERFSALLRNSELSATVLRRPVSSRPWSCFWLRRGSASCP